MDKMGYPRNLISFTTEHNLAGNKTQVFRPRFIGYALVLTVMVSLFLYTIASRIPLQVDIIRDRNLLYRETSEGFVENIYTLKINNMENGAHRYTIEVAGDYDFNYIGDRQVEVAGGEIYSLLVRLELDPGLLREPNAKVYFEVESVDDAGVSATQESRFIGPSRRY
jgi:polyferredoxin